ncbi:MAG TPA: hypothetical protein VLC47_03810, partial [Burkholderiales bacterium]|nr:hypothetical protein [Burkholderiales bacterium]
PASSMVWPTLRSAVGDGGVPGAGVAGAREVAGGLVGELRSPAGRSQAVTPITRTLAAVVRSNARNVFMEGLLSSKCGRVIAQGLWPLVLLQLAASRGLAP